MRHAQRRQVRHDFRSYDFQRSRAVDDADSLRQGGGALEVRGAHSREKRHRLPLELVQRAPRQLGGIEAGA
jgi:hypothetical protein